MRGQMLCRLRERYEGAAMRNLAWLVVLVFAGAASAFGQETTGTISGRVVDAQQLAVPGATVTVTGVQGTKTAVTDAEGRYAIPFLTPGKYSVKAELQGFKTAERTGIVVALGQTVELPFKLEIGTIS